MTGHVLERLPDPARGFRAEGVAVCVSGGLDKVELGNEPPGGCDEAGEARAAGRSQDAVVAQIPHSRLFEDGRTASHPGSGPPDPAADLRPRLCSNP